MDTVIDTWKGSLGRLLEYYEARRGRRAVFFPSLFGFFIIINVLCYWLAMVAVFPGLINWHYFKVQFPVGVLGAVFDSLSFFVTIVIVRRALRTRSTHEYIAHLSCDLVLAVLATFWVVYVFSISGWLINLLESRPQVLVVRNARYEQMLVNAVQNPVSNLRNIAFGLIMGISAMIPTCLHLYMFGRAVFRTHLRRRNA
jgi:hypothetical protein